MWILQPSQSRGIVFSSTELDAQGSNECHIIKDWPSDVNAGNDCLHIVARANGGTIPPPSSRLKRYYSEYEYGIPLYRCLAPDRITFGLFSGTSYYGRDAQHSVTLAPGLEKWVWTYPDLTPKGEPLYTRVHIFEFKYDVENRKIFQRSIYQEGYMTDDDVENITLSQEFSELPGQEWRFYGDSTGYQNLNSRVATSVASSYFNFITDPDVFKYTGGADFGQLCNQAAQAADFNRTNALALVHDILGLRKEIREWPEMLDALFSSKTRQDCLKSLANIFLSGKYGMRLTYHDLRLLSNSFVDKPRPQTIYSKIKEEIVLMGHIFTGYQSVSFDWIWDGYNQLYAYCSAHSLELRAADLWDLVPYSFVVDWFLGIGDRLECWDNQRRVDRMTVSNIWHSHKWISSYDWNTSDWLGSVQVSIYRRYGEKYLAPLSPGSSTPTAQHHLAEGTALIIQRM